MSTIDNIRRGIAKRASSVAADSLASIPGVALTMIPPLGVANAISIGTGLTSRDTLKDVQKRHAAWNMLPGVANHNQIVRQLRVSQAASKSKSPAYWRLAGPAISSVILAGLGAAMGGAVDGSDGAVTGATAGALTGVAAALAGAGAASFTRGRTLKEQREAESSPYYGVKTMLPGVAMYEQFKALGLSDRL